MSAMTLTQSLVFASVALLVSANAASSQTYHAGMLRIEHAWMLPTPSRAPTAAGYLTVTNTGDRPDRLLGASSPSAVRVELHQTTMKDNIMRMRPVAGGVAIAPGQTVAIEPAGYHLMLVGPKRPFVLGQSIPATLRFERSGSVPIAFTVRAGPPAASPMSKR